MDVPSPRVLVAVRESVAKLQRLENDHMIGSTIPSIAEEARPGTGPSPLWSAHGVINFLDRYGRMIAAIVALSVLACFVYLVGATPIYQARAQLMIESRVPHTFIEQISEAMISLDTPQIESQLALLRSEQIAGVVVKKLDLVNDPELQGQIASWKLYGSASSPTRATRSPSVHTQFSPASGSSGPEALEEKLRSAIAGLKSRMDVRRVGLSYAIEITCYSHDPASAARYANAVADAYVEDRLRSRSQSALLGSQWLEERIAHIRQQLKIAALNVQEFRARRDYRIGGRSERASAADEPRAGDVRPTLTTETIAEAPTLEELEARAQTFRKIYESYLQGYTESVQRQSYPVTNDRVITRATKPDRKSHPRSIVLLTMTVILSTSFAFGIALLHYGLADAVAHLRDEMVRTRRAKASASDGPPEEVC